MAFLLPRRRLSLAVGQLSQVPHQPGDFPILKKSMTAVADRETAIKADRGQDQAEEAVVGSIA
ncbi:hypothetical protein IVB25_34990 [Bradyrhizobium sp. 193]|uniref:hypothetical protein n=1 Tax=Bradyrhizobium sp. 193 TaxID=2782661 RepID=UPI001FF9B2FF|nr:hypothetical protein [Bradyrhizobium sp. 193]MCK1487751.1 hypothetical protein [Bradyrhizobium sp. 193]